MVEPGGRLSTWASRRRFLIVILVPLAVLGYETISTAGAAGPVSAATVPCSAMISPYQRPVSDLAACGMKLLPQTSVTTVTSGPTEGATVHTYQADDGGTSSYVDPPTSFDAATATSAQLSAYGVPVEPAARYVEARAMWVKMVHNLHFVAAPPSVIAAPPVTLPEVRNNVDFSYWSGIVNTGSTFTQSEGLFTEPYDSTTSCSNNAASYWVGLGGVNSGDLAQNGTFQGMSGFAQDQGWYEVLPYYAMPTLFQATEGQPLVVSTNEITPTYFIFYFYNYYTGQAVTAPYHLSSSSYDGTTSDFIVERPTVGNPGVLTSLTDFGTVPWYETFSNNNPSVDYSHLAYTMKNPLTGNVLAVPYSYGGTYGQFSDDWYNCQ